MKLIISGSRPPKEIRESKHGLQLWYERHRGVVEEAIRLSGFTDITEVCSGKAKGFDFLGEVWAAEQHIQVKPFPADWDQYGRGAGFIRNSEMAEYADALVAITYGTPGTSNMISCMDAQSKPKFVYDLSRLNAAKPYPPAYAKPGRKMEPGRTPQGPTIVPSRREHAGGNRQP